MNFGELRMELVTKKAYGKVNLFLSVGGNRPDGRHDVENVMCRVGIYDTVAVRKTNDGKVRLNSDNAELPLNEENAAYLAARLYLEKYNLSDGVEISIEKRIPVKGGMAGGSTDSAATLMCMNELFGVAEHSALVEIASKIGADVPFFLYDKPIMLGRGTGTEMQPFPSLKNELYGVFVLYGEKQSTGAMFSLLDKTRSSEFADLKSSFKLKNAIESGITDSILFEMYNDFEVCTKHFEEISDALLSLGAKKVMLSGSGPTVFGIYEAECEAIAAASVLPYRSFVCKIGV